MASSSSSNRTIESGAQLFSRINSENSSTNLYRLNSKLFPDEKDSSSCGSIIEIQYTNEIDHHTDFLIDFIVRTILPATINQEFLDSSVLLVNTEFQIDILQIIKYIEKKMALNNIKDRKMQIIENALKKLDLVNCYSQEQLEISCYNLENFINPKKFTLIVLDNILSQYWCENYRKQLSINEYTCRMLDLIYKQVVRDSNVILIYGKAMDFDDEVSKRKTYENLSFSIETVQPKDKNYMLANVLNVDKHTIESVPFKIDICPIFI